jgi:glyoxylase-like metal-dependent hydrolase (beta-lactamase superfamily II)
LNIEARSHLDNIVFKTNLARLIFSMNIDSFTGGIFDTNCFFLPDHGILIDAPQEAAAWLAERGYQVKLLLLTHGHIDHTWDAAAIQSAHGCKVICHSDTVPLVTERDFFKKLGLGWEIHPLPQESLQLLDETPSAVLEGVDFQVLLVPGHCPGSLCFLSKEAGILFGGDVLFAGGVGRWDLPGGDGELLFRGIREKLYRLDDEITVLPGHGPATKIGIEKRTNPYVSAES